MEFTAIMSSPAQLPQVTNSTVSTVELENPQSTLIPSAPFSKLLEHCAAVGEGTHASIDPSSDNLFLQGIPASMKQQQLMQQQLQLLQQQGLDPEILAAKQQVSFMQLSSDEANDKTESVFRSEDSKEQEGLSQLDGNQKMASESALAYQPWAQLFLTADTFSDGDTGKQLTASSRQPSDNPAEIANSALGVITASGFMESGKGVETSGQLSAYSPEIGGESAAGRERFGNLPSCTTSETAGTFTVLQEPATPGGPPLIMGITLNQRISEETGANAVGVVDTTDNNLQQGNNSTDSGTVVSQGASGIPLQPDTLQKADLVAQAVQNNGKPAQGEAIFPITGESKGGAFGQVRGVVTHAVLDTRPAGRAAGNPNSGTPGAEIKGLSTNSDPTRIDMGQALQIDNSSAVSTKSLLKGTGDDVQSKTTEDKSASISNNTLFVHGQEGAKARVENTLSASANDSKLPSAEQIYHQVREKVESGDYGLKKNSITMKLHPEELGELKINLRMEEQRLKVDIVTENRSVKEALMQNLDTLKESLSRQNISMDSFNITADIKQGVQQETRDENRMMQDNRGSNVPIQTKASVEENAQPKLNYGWENDDSLVSLVL